MNYELEKVHISTINIGDTVMFDGHKKTVGVENLKQCSFMGHTLFGDSFNLGAKPVEKVTFLKPVSCTVKRERLS